jgi:hypothetical protein
VDRELQLRVDRSLRIDRLTGHVHQAAERLRSDRNQNRVAGVDHGRAAGQTVGRVHCDRADPILAEMLLHLADQRGILAVLAGEGDFQRVEDIRELPLGELGVNDGSDNLDDLPCVHRFDAVVGIRCGTRAGSVF